VGRCWDHEVYGLVLMSHGVTVWDQNPTCKMREKSYFIIAKGKLYIEYRG